MTNKYFLLKSIDDTFNLAKKITSIIDQKSVILLNGDLGVGKTTLAKNIIKLYLENEDLIITSPSFNIINEYIDNNIHIDNSKERNKKSFIHCDLYRLNNKEEIIQIGLIDLIYQEISPIIIEWPEIIKDYINNIKKDRIIDITISFNSFDDTKIDNNYELEDRSVLIKSYYIL
ncbi:tRNA (adenosine(37)-N6)-threonylcarbamoyltransferase complex ATPase subunit type 1 TsaE [Lyticum sinuosum]|uniref:tRNA threonylcarbamoyladenosine biosynthesis protein TsaE n=1 Tax=Lyticum sinuosum TaxID=1332059 RepID=A0AAE5AHX7_9RICK|nr:tRNA (adenosine(37)-N6)-threonylcarbamoyltransferase complex ATPase subunit type 1 TsaE [Lyticum sinuosum]MDZ5761521.1 tRNA threonylcarbamoyladenosine biosynthesis protein TsaE [Lyticum sinuosum]